MVEPVNGPYRSPPTQAAYICTLCFKSASIAPGDCCGQARQELRTQENENLVRERLARLREARRKRDNRLILVGALVSTVLITWLEQATALIGHSTFAVAFWAFLWSLLMGYVISDVVARKQGWPKSAWMAPFDQVLAFLDPRVVDAPKIP